MDRREPIFNVPIAVTAVLATLIGVHVGRQLLPDGIDDWVVLALAFIPARYAGFAAELPGGEVASVTSLVTHMAVHGDAGHLLINSAWLLAFGGAIARRTGGWRFLAFSVATGLAGALLFLVLNLGLLAPVVGASGAVSGMMGGTMRFMFAALDRGGVRQLRESPQSVPLMSLSETLRDRRVRIATTLWLLLNVLAVIGIGTGEGRSAIAWEAHIGGFVAGLLGFGLIDRPLESEPESTADPL